MGKLPTMRSDNSEILPYNFKDWRHIYPLGKTLNCLCFYRIAPCF